MKNAKNIYIWANVSGNASSDLVEESGSRQDHGELTGVVGVVEPGLMVDVPRVVPPGEAHNAISGLAPHSVRHRRTQKLTEIFIFSINSLRLNVQDQKAFCSL